MVGVLLVRLSESGLSLYPSLQFVLLLTSGKGDPSLCLASVFEVISLPILSWNS